MITLRFALPNDAEALLDIYRPYVEETTVSFETEVPSIAVFRQRIADISGLFPYLIAQENGEILGYAYAHPFHERAAFRWTVESSVYVRQDVRGRHVGKVLYDALLPLLRIQGIQTVCAVVTIPNDPSMAFHQAMGFREEGLLQNVGYKLGVWRSVAYLCLRLGPSNGEPPALLGIHKLDPELIAGILSDATRNDTEGKAR